MLVKKAIQKGFINEVREEDIVSDLNLLESSSLYMTRSVRRYNTDKWPNNEMPFVDFHMGYLRSHPALDPKQYIANLRLILRNGPR